MVSLGGTLGWGPVLHGWVGVRARGRGSFPGSVLPMVPTCDSSSSACVRETVCARDRDHLRGCHHGHGDCRKGDPFQGLRGGSWLLLRNELSKETHMLTKQETLLERVESSRVREPRRTALSCSPQSQFYGDGVSFQVVSGQSTDPWTLLVLCASLSQDGCQYSGRW